MPKFNPLLLVFFPALTGCVAVAAGGVAGAVGVVALQEKSVGQSIDDAATSNAIKSELLSEDGYGEVDVEVANGLVLLSGRVIAPEMRVEAERIAWSVDGTEDVANEIQIEPPGGFRKNASDAWISTRVRARLLADRDVRLANFNVETYDGVVYLMGLARTDEEHREAAERASLVPGVKKVVSYVQVRWDPRAEDLQTGDDTEYTGETDAAPDLAGAAGG